MESEFPPHAGRRPHAPPGNRRRVLLDTMLPPLVGLLLGGAVGAGLALARLPAADLSALIGGGAAVGLSGGALLTAFQGARIRAPDDRDGGC